MKRILMGLSLMPFMALATTWYVDGTTGTDENPGTSPTEAKATIQAAIDVSVDGDTILVAPGTYAPITSNNKAITIMGVRGQTATIIDGKHKSRCATLGSNAGDRNTILDGFTISAGYTDAVCGSGVLFGTLKNCYLVGCTNAFGFAGSGGGGASNVDAFDCVFEYNCATHGGGLHSGTATRCIFRNNYAFDDGGAVAINVTAKNCLMVGNRVDNWGGGGSGAACAESCTNFNCTIVGNYATSGDIVCGTSKAYNCIIYENSCGQGTIFGSGAIIENCFTNDPHFVDAANGDYRLAADSPCVDAGDNSYVMGESDLDGSGRIVNGKVDIGCYEYGSVGGPYVEKVGETNWTYMIKNGKASVGDGANAAVDKAISGAVNVPTTLRTRPVVAIDDNALQGCTNMTSVTIPAGVKTIGDRAFEGCGKLADVYYEGETLSSIGADAFRGCYWDLIMHVPTTWQGRGRTICGYTVWKGDDPNEVVRVVSTNVVVHYMTTNVPVEVVAPISADTGIVNVMTEVKGGNVAIPDSWAKGFATFEAKFGSNFTDALTKQTGKYDCNNTPMLVWQDYVAGTDPTNPDDTFTATITMVGGVPQVAWKPVLTEEAAAKRVYRKFGKVKLTDEWVEIPSGHETDYNFFKVTVEMK